MPSHYGMDEELLRELLAEELGLDEGGGFPTKTALAAGAGAHTLFSPYRRTVLEKLLIGMGGGKGGGGLTRKDLLGAQKKNLQAQMAHVKRTKGKSLIPGMGRRERVSAGRRLGQRALRQGLPERPASLDPTPRSPGPARVGSGPGADFLEEVWGPEPTYEPQRRSTPRPTPGYQQSRAATRSLGAAARGKAARTSLAGGAARMGLGRLAALGGGAGLALMLAIELGMYGHGKYKRNKELNTALRNLLGGEPNLSFEETGMGEILRAAPGMDFETAQAPSGDAQTMELLQEILGGHNISDLFQSAARQPGPMDPALARALARSVT